MDLKTIVFLLADVVMVLAGAVYGWKLLKKKNYLLGIEWFVVAVSGTNFFFYSLSGSPVLYNISYFFDAFSRAFGFPVIAIAGLMAVSHHYRPSTLADIAFFAASSVGAAILVSADAYPSAKAWFYVVMWTAYSAYLVYFAWRLFKAGNTLHGWGLLSVMVTSQAIASIYDFWHIPGDDDQHTLFYIAALLVWGYALFETYNAYCALERAENT